MNFEKFRFYLAEPDIFGDYVCVPIKNSNYTRTPKSHLIIIEKSWPSFLDRLRISWILYPMDVKIKQSK